MELAVLYYATTVSNASLAPPPPRLSVYGQVLVALNSAPSRGRGGLLPLSKGRALISPLPLISAFNCNYLITICITYGTTNIVVFFKTLKTNV